MPPRRPPRRPFGRRPLRPRPIPGRRPLPHPYARPLNPRLQRELKRANHLMNTGDHANAAQIFASLAGRAQDRGILGPAAMLFLQAGRAYLLSAAVEQALVEAMNGFKLMAADQRWPALEREGDRFVAELERQGKDAEAAKLRSWLDEKLGEHASGKPEQEKAQLPEKCPYCGASMSLEQVSGHEAAECRYCGSVVLPVQMD